MLRVRVHHRLGETSDWEAQFENYDIDLTHRCKGRISWIAKCIEHHLSGHQDSILL